MSGFYKGVSGLSLFISIPLLICYLGDSDYGLWVLVFALFQWVLLMDFGLASVLKTKIPVLIHENKQDLLKSYLKSTYKITAYIALALFIFFLVLIYFLDLKTVLKIPIHSNLFIKKLFIINMFFFCLNFLFNVHKSLFVAFLKGKYAEQSIAVNQFLFLISIICLIFISPNIDNTAKLLCITMLNGLVCFFVNALYTIFFFYQEKLNLKTTVKTSKEFLREIIVLGTKYMVIQVGLLVVFSSDNYILSSVFGPKDIVPYDVVNKYYQFPIMILFATLSPLWSMFANHYIQKEKKTLLKTFRQFNLLFLLMIGFIVFISLICPFVISMWIKGQITIPKGLILYTALATVFRVFVTFYTFFLNGIGKLNKYIILLLLSVVLKIPLSYYFIKLGLGINSVMISTLLILLIWIIYIPLECYNIVYKIKSDE
jgi:O-antigen/teichoic acid export membrane protein